MNYIEPNKMQGNKEKRDKYYPIAYELYGKNIFDNNQMQKLYVTKNKSAEIDETKEKDEYEISQSSFFNKYLNNTLKELIKE